MTENRYSGRKPSKLAGTPAQGTHRRRSAKGRQPRLSDGRTHPVRVKRLPRPGDI